MQDDDVATHAAFGPMELDTFDDLAPGLGPPCRSWTSPLQHYPSRAARSVPAKVDNAELGPSLPSTRMVLGCHADGSRMDTMADELGKKPPRLSETEKITVNLGPVDLGQIDLLVQEGFYSNRTDLIRTAIRNQLATHADAIKQTVARKSLVLGLQHFSRRDLEAVRDAGEKLEIKVLGLASIGADVTPKLASDAIDSIVVLGALHASPAVRAALGGRIR